MGVWCVGAGAGTGVGGSAAGYVDAASEDRVAGGADTGIGADIGVCTGACAGTVGIGGIGACMAVAGAGADPGGGAVGSGGIGTCGAIAEVARCAMISAWIARSLAALRSMLVYAAVPPSTR